MIATVRFAAHTQRWYASRELKLVTKEVDGRCVRDHLERGAVHVRDEERHAVLRHACVSSPAANYATAVSCAARPSSWLTGDGQVQAREGGWVSECASVCCEEGGAGTYMRRSVRCTRTGR